MGMTLQLIAMESNIRLTCRLDRTKLSYRCNGSSLCQNLRGCSTHCGLLVLVDIFQVPLFLAGSPGLLLIGSNAGHCDIFGKTSDVCNARLAPKLTVTFALAWTLGSSRRRWNETLNIGKENVNGESKATSEFDFQPKLRRGNGCTGDRVSADRCRTPTGAGTNVQCNLHLHRRARRGVPLRWRDDG